MKLTCIVCPNGCKLEIDEITKVVTGNKCVRGESFANEELIAPKRTITTTVRTVFKECPVLPVRLTKEVPKEKIFDCLKEINKVLLTEKLKRGDIIIKNILGLDSDVIVTSDRLLKG